VFKVFDNQGSGNICFGVSDGDKRYFIKFAGTRLTEGAIKRLKMAVPVYQDLAHPTLIRFIKAEDVGGGFVAVFEWVDAWCMYEGYPEDHRQFKELTLETRIQIFEELLDFHSYAASKGYNAYDFYDGNIMWDYVNEKAVLCDIDFYSKSWYKGANHIWNDLRARWTSPEEWIKGATLDEISTGCLGDLPCFWRVKLTVLHHLGVSFGQYLITLVNKIRMAHRRLIAVNQRRQRSDEIIIVLRTQSISIPSRK
jgi:serine/threonine-protein kinase